MAEVFVRRVQSVDLADTSYRRVAPRPEPLRQAGYDDGFDSTTLVYDLVRTHPRRAVLIMPPLENLAGGLSIEQAGTLLVHRVEKLDRVTRIWLTLCDLDADVTVCFHGNKYVLTLPSPAASPVEGLRTIQTLSKNNHLNWIRDWAKFYATMHGTEAVLFYDNGSTDYDILQLADLFASISEIRVAVIVEWPFSYGPGGGEFGRWDSDYCQPGTWEHGRWAFNYSSRSVINCDIDELAISKNHRRLHEDAEKSLFGGVQFDGRWISDLVDDCDGSSSLSEHASLSTSLPGQRAHSSYWLYLSDDNRSPAKWAIVPRRIPSFAQPWTHGVRRWWLPRSRSVLYRHLRAISTNWRAAQRGWNYTRPGMKETSRSMEREGLRPVVDVELRDAFRQMGWLRR